jgi:hypothetical protein
MLYALKNFHLQRCNAAGMADCLLVIHFVLKLDLHTAHSMHLRGCSDQQPIFHIISVLVKDLRFESKLNSKKVNEIYLLMLEILKYSTKRAWPLSSFISFLCRYLTATSFYEQVCQCRLLREFQGEISFPMRYEIQWTILIAIIFTMKGIHPLAPISHRLSTRLALMHLHPRPWVILALGADLLELNLEFRKLDAWYVLVIEDTPNYFACHRWCNAIAI